MKSFAQSLDERIRTKKQAKKLLNYLTRRKSFDTGEPRNPQPHYIKPLAPKAAEEEAEKVFTHKLRFLETRMVSVKDVHTIQNAASIIKLKDMLDRKQVATKAIVVVSIRKKLLLIDGNHRLSAVKLRGEKEILADVYTITEKRLKKWTDTQRLLQMR